MKNILILLLMLIFAVVGCSKKNEEATQLEQELMGETTEVTDDVDASRFIDTAAQEEAETIVEEPAVVEQEALPTQPAGSGYTVQVAGCEDEAYARFLVDKYTQRGFEPFVTTTIQNGVTYHRVRIGIFDSLAEAKTMQAELKDRYSVESWVDYADN